MEKGIQRLEYPKVLSFIIFSFWNELVEEWGFFAAIDDLLELASLWWWQNFESSTGHYCFWVCEATIRKSLLVFWVSMLSTYRSFFVLYNICFSSLRIKSKKIQSRHLKGIFKHFLLKTFYCCWIFCFVGHHETICLLVELMGSSPSLVCWNLEPLWLVE